MSIQRRKPFRHAAEVSCAATMVADEVRVIPALGGYGRCLLLLLGKQEHPIVFVFTVQHQGPNL